jgi:hypothetical protein
VRALRPPHPRPRDPGSALGWLWEQEREPGGEGERRPALTVFLAGAECPWSCVFCDLWRHTLAGPTPPGALPAQLAAALAGAGPLPAASAAKLYNASNFFDPHAVPPGDDEALVTLLAPFSRVTVECHPRLLGERCWRFRDRLAASPSRTHLEVAMGLETVHPGALPRLGKGVTLAAFDRAAAALAVHGVALRAFVLLAPPFVPAVEAVEWAVRSVRHALGVGARRVSIIPTRGGNGALEALAAAGDFRPPSLAQLEESLDAALAVASGEGAVVTVDLWDAPALFAGEPCLTTRLQRLARINEGGAGESPHRCGACATTPPVAERPG